jgi:hypothetical protein
MDFLLDSEQELTLTADGDLQLTSSLAEARKQEIEISLATHKGEWLYDESIGIPWLTLMGKKDNDTAIVNTASKTILAIPDVVSCEIAIEHSGIEATITFVAKISDGTTVEGAA